MAGRANQTRRAAALTVGACLAASMFVPAALAAEVEDTPERSGEPGLVPGDQQAQVPAEDLASALDSEAVVGAEFVTGPPDSSAAIVASEPVVGFPRQGDDFVMLSTGDASMAYDPNDSESTSSDFAVTERGVQDPTVLRLDLEVPESANCLIGMDFRFASEEYPEFVGSNFNDAFVAEVGDTTWSVDGQNIDAPRNFAFDEQANPITVNAAGDATMNEAAADGTTYDGASTLLTAATPLEPGPESVYLSIFDVGDGIYDSTVMVDNIRVGEVADVEEDCVPGAEDVDPQEYVSLGDSYSSGFGVEPYHEGTHTEENDCQRSTLAYSEVLAENLDLDNSFHACQSAVTEDFYDPSGDRESWGEEPQLDNLTEDTGLVTFTIGGNDSGFSQVLQDCIDGWELLPFNTCHGDERVTDIVGDAFDDLAGRRNTDDQIHPYSNILGDVRERSPYADLVALGYPRFYPPEGVARHPVPGGRCEGVKQADQRWVNEKVDEINGILETEAERFGYRFANPSDRFAGHELCGETGEEWIFPLLSSGRIHPTADGHEAMADEAEEVLSDEDDPSFVVEPGETVSTAYVIEDGTVRTTVVLRWPGSDVETTLVSPSGEEYSRQDLGGVAEHSNGPTHEQFELADPEPGEWTIESHGADVEPDGEPVHLTTTNEGPSNERPQAVPRVRRDGDTVQLDATESTDPDGEIDSYTWYVEFADSEVVVDEVTGEAEIPTTEPVSVTLVVTDDEGLTEFATTTDVAAQVQLEEGRTDLGEDVEMALLSAEIFDATSMIDQDTLRLGPAETEPSSVDVRDVNDDGHDDVVLEARYDDLGFTGDEEQLCTTGALSDERGFRACDAVSLPDGGPDPDPTDDPDPDPTDDPDPSPDPDPTDEPDEDHPDTGVDVGTLVALAALLFVGGAAVVVARRSVHPDDGGQG